MSYNSNHGTNTKKNKKATPLKRAAAGAPAHLDRGEVDWDELPNGVERGLIMAVLNRGGAVMFSRSSDGGALGVRVYHDDHEVSTVWGRPDEGYTETLREITRYYEAYKEEATK